MIRPPTRQPIKKRTHKAMKKRDHAYIPPRSADRLRLQPRAGARAQCPHALASLPSTDANAWLPRIVAIGNGRPRRFRRQHREYPAAYAPLASRPRSSNPHSRARKTAQNLPAVSSLGGFRAPAPAHAQPSQRPAPETLHLSGSSRPPDDQLPSTLFQLSVSERSRWVAAGLTVARRYRACDSDTCPT